MPTLRVIRACACGSGEIAEPIYDGRGHYLTGACPQCRLEKLRCFHADLLDPGASDDPRPAVAVALPRYTDELDDA